MKASRQDAGREGQARVPKLFAGLLGAFFGLALLKFGNPPIMEKWVSVPANAYEFILGSPWPIAWAYCLLGGISLLGLACARWPNNRRQAKWSISWLLILPAAWLFWQCVATTQTLDQRLSAATLSHFVACVVCFYLGFFSLGGAQHFLLFCGGLVGGFLLVLAIGWQQHFGGLEETRRYFFLYIYPKLKEVSPEYLKKMSSSRIFATLFYPNALAGALLLFLPTIELALWRNERRFSPGARRFLVILAGIGALGCLYWSGSKGGWLLMLLIGLIALLRLPLSRRLKAIVLFGVLLAGLAGFAWKYAGFFHRGATSVSARFDYWHAALETARQRPWLGTGPGTFAIPYQKIKKPESEMARLVHNDYLEQASDSGLPGLLLYSLFIFCAISWSFERALGDPSGLAFAAWLGTLAWALQGFFEFPLYIPALSWPAFTFLGWLLQGRTPAEKTG